MKVFITLIEYYDAGKLEIDKVFTTRSAANIRASRLSSSTSSSCPICAVYIITKTLTGNKLDLIVDYAQRQVNKLAQKRGRLRGAKVSLKKIKKGQ